jgi:hypothetical protein
MPKRATATRVCTSPAAGRRAVRSGMAAPKASEVRYRIFAMVAEQWTGCSVASCMSSLTTTYFDHQIIIEPAEWGFLILIVVPGSGVRHVAVNTSAMQALENAFDLIDNSLQSSVDRKASPQDVTLAQGRGLC